MAVLWIRIRMDLHHFGNLDPHPDSHPHKKNQDSDPHQFADVKPKCMEYEPILALFQGFEPFFETGSGSASG
jgi:hypothetical protein